MINNNLSSLLYFVPELIIIIGLLTVILLEIIPGGKKWVFKVALASIVISFICLFLTLNQNIQLFMGLIVSDPFSTFFKIIFLLSTLVIVLVSESSVEIKRILNQNIIFLF